MCSYAVVLDDTSSNQKKPQVRFSDDMARGI